MDSCFPLVKTSSVSSALTVAHLIRNIEQLKNKDKLISQLEKDLGRQSGASAAHFAVLERRRSEGNPLPHGGLDLSPAFRTLPEGSDTPDPFLWTPTSIQTPGDVEDAWTNEMEGNVSLGKTDLPIHLKGTKDRSNKGLLDKCRSYLQQNKELTAQNRAFKESNDRASQDNKNAQELLEHSKLQLLQMSRQLNQLKTERSEWEEEMRSVEGLRQELMEDKKMINALRKACSDKDRRIELIQHRKKRRRLIESVEKAKIQSAGLKETPFGYEEDDRHQADGNQSVCSLSSTISDDSVWDEVLSKEETERNYQRLMMEQLELQRSHALLQKQSDSMQDPQRENLSKADLQNDLFLSQYRVEQLEHFIREGLQGKSDDMWEEKERMKAHNKSLNTMVKSLEKENKRLQSELSNAREKNEDMEFRLIELEECKEKEVPCPDTDESQATNSTSDKNTESSPSSPADSVIEEPAYATSSASGMMEQLAKELTVLLKDKGRDAESALKKMNGLLDREKAIENMAHELQMKVISLQQEKNSLQDRLLLVEQSQPGLGGHSSSLAQAKERQENLALKAEIDCQTRLASERINLQGQVDDLKVENDALKQRIEVFVRQQEQKQEIAKEEVIEQLVQPSVQTPNTSPGKSSPKVSKLSRKSSDRKSKSRDESEPISSKKRKSSPENENDDRIENQFGHFQNKTYETKSVADVPMPQCGNTNEAIGTMTDKHIGTEDVQSKLSNLEQELINMKNCNDDLMSQLNESMSYRMDLEASQKLLQEKLSSMEEGFDLLHKENVALGNQLRQRVEEFQLTQDERSPMVSELEEFCEDLQDRLKEAENCERQLREKLKLFEKTIDEAEINEIDVRERCEQLLAGDYEAKKQIQDLQRTGLELRDIVLEKEIVEQALRDKADFLQKAEAASVERIEELEAIVEDLRQQVDDKSQGKNPLSKDVHKMTEMKHQMTFLETDNKALTARVSELEENEEILRENWRRVAEEDFNRTQSLEEKVKMLEGLNRDLKVKLKDAQEYLVVDMSRVSLAAELEESESRLFDDSSDENDIDTDDLDDVDSPVKEGGSEEKKAMKEKVRKLERQLSEVAEEKNTKIEGLQERLVDLQETEIKLSETISEMEMTERELRAKLALYESSEVTVEKMLKYQSKIEELRTSQESLLDQLEIKEHEGMTLHEKMQEMERTLRGKIVTLEVEMKGYKQKELRNAGHIRDLEKQEKELSDKVAQQAEKENGLYVRISSLMDELKTSKTELENVKKQMEDKDDKVRQAKLLEVKLLEIEMECGKKVSTLNAKLRHKEEEFRQKESAYEQQISNLQDLHHHNSQMETEFAQREQNINKLEMEKSDLTSKIAEMKKNSDEATSKIQYLENELESERMKVGEKESQINHLREEIKSKIEDLECVVAEKENEHQALKDSLESEIHLKEKRVLELEEKLKDVKNVEKRDQESALVVMSDLQSFSDNCVSDIEQKMTTKLSFLETKLKSVEHHISELHSHISEQYMNICIVEAEREEQRNYFNKSILELEKEKDSMENELRAEIMTLNDQLQQERSKKESEQSDKLKESLEREASLRFDVSNLQHQVEQHKRELIGKLSELEAKNKAHCELSLELSNLRHDHKILQKESEKSKQSCTDMALSLKSVTSQKDEQLSQSSDTIVQLNKVIEELKVDIDQKNSIIDQITVEKDSMIEEKDEENKSLIGEKARIENMLQEKSKEFDRVSQHHIQSEKELGEIRKILNDRDSIIKRQDQEKEMKEMKLKETESHAQSVQVDKESLTLELQSVKNVLEDAENQITRQQQELQLLHTRLQSQQDDIKQLQSIVKEKEEKLQEKDQMYEQKSSELKKLSEQLEDRDQKLEQADCKVAAVELKLQKAENRVRELESMQVSLEMRLEERYSVSQNSEKVLRSKELQCHELESKLDVSEKNLANLKDQISVENESSKELAQRLKVKEDEVQQKDLELSSVKDSLKEKESLLIALESKFCKLEGDVESTNADLIREIEEHKKIVSEKESLIYSMTNRLEKSESDLQHISSELDSTKGKLEVKEEECKEYETKLAHLEESHSGLKTRRDSLECNLQLITQELDEKASSFTNLQEKMDEKSSELMECKEQLKKNSQEVKELLVKLDETGKVLSNKEAVIEKMTEENQNLTNTVDKLSLENKNAFSKEENLHQELINKNSENSNLISKLESVKSDLTFSNESLRKENSELQEKLRLTEDDLNRTSKDHLQVHEAKDSLSKQLSDIQGHCESLQMKIDALESDIAQSNAEKEKMLQEASIFKEENIQLEADNTQLQKENEEAAREFQMLTISFEESKNNIEQKLLEISEGKQKAEDKFEALEKEYTKKTSEISKILEGKDKELESFQQKYKQLTQDNNELTAKVDCLEKNFKETEAQSKSKSFEGGMKVEDEIVCESMMSVNMSPSLQSNPSSRKSLDNKLEDDVETSNIQKKDQQTVELEIALNEMKNKEKCLEKRVSELETVEKELREQIVDIEVTVIVPLENENQDLKDEIGMVKQERDEAISKISKWDDDDDEDGSGRVQESETLHQRLEDALIYGEELEKKNEILLVDIQKVEHENESLQARITDLEVSESEKNDEIEHLQDEINRLSDNHQDASVLEETETTLMDKVLDLEEREKNLLQELEQLKNNEKTGMDADGLSEKVKYFERKIQILEDAEGRYMDKIMELEEDKHRLLSKLSPITDSHDSQVSQSHPSPHSCVNNLTVSSSTQTSVPFESNTLLGATNSSDGVDLTYHSDSLSSSGQTSSAISEDLQKHSILEDELQEYKVKLGNANAHLREKEALALYLQDKLELLQESEGKLMDKLLEAEEKASSDVHSKYLSQINELHKKIEQIQEENEFLAENVEQYKQSFKEEKKKCNNLEDRLMEDSVNLAELQRTQEELVKTQHMVEDIQSEYEDQLSERDGRERKLKEELSIVFNEKVKLEQIVNAKGKREEELQEEMERLKSTEKELRSRLTSLPRTIDDDSTLSDSGVSADDPRIRSDQASVVEEPLVHRSVKTVQLTTPPKSKGNIPPTSPQSPEPVPLPRYKRKLRLSSIEKIPHEELVFLVEDLQERETALKKRVSDLQAVDESDLSQKVFDLENDKLQLERRLRYVEQRHTSSPNPSGKSTSPVGDSFHLPSGVPLSSTAMLEKPEDVLNQRIKELEGLDKHNKNMVSELERDREVLHEIARKDKAAIHDLNVKIRELQLSERSLKEQVTNLEVSESSYFNKCEELEALRVKLEDRVHELEIHERRLRELVRKLKLDEERWLSKSSGMENAFAELSANEAQLKRIVQDIEMEKGGLSERLEYMESRIRELESVEVALLARIKDYENNEVILQNRNVQLENAEAAAHSKASELDVINVNLTQQHKKMVDENAVMAQHLAQLHGQVQDLDRRLLSSRDSEIAYKQHVESLQKNESLLQKKVREYELREIDSQSAIRELEQTAEINNDKLAALQRSENRLRYRVQELEGVGGQIPGELTPSQQQKLPQNIEDCQKRVVVLQSQVENLKLQLKQTLNTTQQQSADKSDDEEKDKSNNVTIGTEEYSQLHVKAAMLDEYAYQNEELESSHEQLRDTVLQLRQGKGVCGHEVEIEVYKRRIESLQTFIRKLKFSLSEGQTTSLLESELDSGPHGETLPARHLQSLESERVLQSVRGLHHNGKADDTNTIDTNGSVHAAGLAPVQDSMIQAAVAQNMASPPSSTTPESSNGGQRPEQPTRLEESHWKAIEARKPVTGNDSRGGVNAQPGTGGIKAISSSPRHHGNQPGSTQELEDVTGVLNLHSESELSSYQRTNTHNESDSCSSPIPPPRKNRANRLSKNMSDDNSSVNTGSGSDRDQRQPHYSAEYNTASANQKHFGDGKSLPLTASNIEKQFHSQQQQQQQHHQKTPLSRFAEDSFYLPSSTQEGVDSLDDDESPPPLPSQGPPGQEMAALSGRSSRASMDEGRRESLDNSTSGLSIRERIAMIEKHLQSDAHTGSHSNREEEDQLFYWKRKSTENLRQAETLDKNNKFLKEDINRLEKELEEKRRYINTLELWLSTTEDLLKNKAKQTDREMVEQLQLDLTKLRRELRQSGYRSEDAMLDPAALKTELEHKDKEISSKRMEIESLAQELRRCHKECRSIEGMRRTALDSLRALEKEVVQLQDTEEKFKKAQAEINSLKLQYDEMDQFKNQALAMVQPLQMKVDTLTKKCREKDLLLRRLRAEMKRGIYHPSSALEELTRLDRAMNGEEYNTDNSDSISDDLSPRPNIATTNTISNHKLRARSVSMDELSFNSDTDSLHHSMPTAIHPSPRRQRPTPYINTGRPRSAEASSNIRSPRRGLDNQTSSLQHRLRGFDLNQEQFVAIADYDPGLYSQSGWPRLEMALREGDQVRVTGPMDKQGYCEAECNGRSGLVPANYLQAVVHSGMNGHHNPHSPGRGHQQHHHYHHHPHQQLQHPSPSVIHLDHNVAPPPPQFQDNQHYNSNGHPDPPHSLHVRGIEDGCVVLAWKPPRVDARGCNKGFQVKGYMVYVDNREYEQIPSPQHCQVAIEGISLSAPHHLEVQSLCAGGHASPRAQLVFEGMVRVGGTPLQQHDDSEGDGPLDTDLSSVLNSVHYTKGARKKVMALYEYNPKDQSPHDYTSFELAFHPGDIISVYGTPRPDGFYHGEMEGKRGLVPACFVEDLASRHGKHGSQDSGHESSKA